jgi:sulfofructosephosphate aldolase
MPSPVADRLAALARPSGAFAMLALDQRESLRAMLAAAHADTTDAALSRFKVDAARTLTPHASAVLVDVAYGLAAIHSARVVAHGCGLIVAADRLTQQPGGVVEDTRVDDAVLADDGIATTADAYKLLVIWRPDRGADDRRRTVTRFVEACRRRGRPAIVEGIVRPAADAPMSPSQHATAVLAAARELGALGPDIYKAEVPTLGGAADDVITHAARQLSDALGCPWVVLSNGTPADRFADSAIAACRGGASGFLAGRAIWASSIEAPDVDADLATRAAGRLRDLATRVDAAARPWPAAVDGARRT